MSADFDQLGDLEFRRSAAAIRKAVDREDAAGFQTAVRKQHRQALRRLHRSMATVNSAALWSESVLAKSHEDRELATALKSARKRRRGIVNQLLKACDSSPASPLTLLVALETVGRHGDQLKPEEFVRLYGLLASVDTVSSAGSAPESELPGDSLQLICDAELPWAISILFSEIKGHRSRQQASSKRLQEALEEATDTDGMLHSSLTSVADEWLAPFTRATMWGSAFGESWAGRMSGRLSDSVAFCVHLLIPNGLTCRPPATLRDKDDRPADVLQHALRATGYRASSPYAQFVQSVIRKKSKAGKTTKRSKNAELSSQSDWAESAIMRNGLQVDSDSVVLNWPSRETSLHLAPLGTPLISGSWESRITINGKLVSESPEWTCSCWFTDDEAAFAELEADPTDSLHLVRHVMLSLKDRLAVVCESVTCSDAEAEIQFESRLPLAADPLAVTNSITRELVLHANCVSTRVVPAWLEDDRIQHALGNCDKQDNQLVSSASGAGGVTVPLVFDWHPERQSMDADWARLTVTEDRVRSSAQQAAGFRVRIGKRQLFIYRSLVTADAPRAVMGQHTINETVYGRVRKSGDIAPLVLVEGELE